jgi:hypothetical protein
VAEPRRHRDRAARQSRAGAAGRGCRSVGALPYRSRYDHRYVPGSIRCAGAVSGPHAPDPTPR